MIQLTRSGARLATPDDVTRLRTRFANEQCVLLARLVEPALLRTIRRRIEVSAFEPFVSGAVGLDQNLHDPLTVHLLHFLTNDPSFLQTIRDITGCADIDLFQGRVYRLDPAVPNRDDWHDDMCENRLIGMSVNLGTAAFDGGVFQMRDRPSHRTIHEVANTGAGDAIVFRLASNLQHRNTRVTGAVAKTSFAGWFRSHQPGFYSAIRGSANSRDAKP